MLHWLMQILPTSVLLALPLSAPTPIQHKVFGQPRSAAQIMVLLPGMRDDMHDFVRQGFIAAVQPRIDSGELAVITVNATLGYYQHKNMVQRLHADVMQGLPQGKSVTLVGISLGGFGALSYTRWHPEKVQRLWLLAPFMGQPEFISRLRKSGLTSRAGDSDLQRSLLANWRLLSAPPAGLEIRLGYGRDDDFAAAYRLLAKRAPGLKQSTIDGEHDWGTWLDIWKREFQHSIEH